jgi:3-mercaptopropionate dioxygenase
MMSGVPAEYVLDTAIVRGFIDGVRAEIEAAGSAADACGRIRPAFAELLADPDWLPLSLFSLVVPPGAETPVHDHLAWGLVGLYRGTQDEDIYTRGERGLELVEQRALAPGDFYVLLPPRDDIHRVRTTSPETSVSIHLLTNDTGCVWRHAYDPDTGEERPFRSGYVNVPCE